LPNEPESYVHRIGRTARAGGEGIAISFCDPTERGYLRDIERLIRNKITAVAHELPELTEAQKAQAEEPRRPHGHRHGKPHGHKAKSGHNHGGHKGGGHNAGGHNNSGQKHGEQKHGQNPGQPGKKRNGSRGHWHRKRDAA